jgi:transcriptional regulator with XRE-family HTH domain
VPIGIGERLRAIRREWQLSLREVEERTLRFAQEHRSQSHQVPASWLARLKSEKHELTVSKLISLANIYNIPAEHMLHSICPVSPQPILRERPTPNMTMLLTEGPLEEQAKYMLTEPPNADELPDETVLLPIGGALQATFRRGIIGKRDRTLAPMILPGSIVHIDTQKRAISLRKDWKHEFQRPIYFLMTREGYVCGWCELDKKSEWLTLVPHPLSRTSSRRWKYRTEIENLGRVVVAAIRLAE